tara:strand:- start:1475 stop:3028 length:1554 start_codon:yes stop_codon:yes gene_type:complete
MAEGDNSIENSDTTTSTNNKASTKEQRASKSETGTVGIEFIKNIVNLIKPYELSPPQRLRTYQAMMLDDSVFDAFNTGTVYMEEAFANYTVEFNNSSENSKAAAKFVNWNFQNLKGQSIRSIARSAGEFSRDGLAPMEKVFERSYGEHKKTPYGVSAWKVKKLNYIHPLTLYTSEPFVITDGGNAIKEMRQASGAFKNSASESATLSRPKKGYVSIPRNKLLLLTYGSTDSQPFGTSLFDAAYTAWREKILLQDLTAVGVAKDLGGTPVLRLPVNILNDAAADPTSSAGLMVAKLQESMANLHAGDQASMIMPSDTFNDTGMGAKEFDLELIGISGSGKNFDLEALVEQRRKFIYSVFGAANLISNDSSGGYNQLEGQTNLHSKFIRRNISVVEEAINSDLLPQLFRLNEWDISLEDMPKIKAGEMSPASLDEVGKAVQRTKSVGMLPITVETVNEVLAKMGFSYRVPEATTKEELTELLGDMESKASEGMKTAFEGTSKGKGSTSNSSDNNNDNAS